MIKFQAFAFEIDSTCHPYDEVDPSDPYNDEARKKKAKAGGEAVHARPPGA